MDGCIISVYEIGSLSKVHTKKKHGRNKSYSHSSGQKLQKILIQFLQEEGNTARRHIIPPGFITPIKQG